MNFEDGNRGKEENTQYNENNEKMEKCVGSET